MWRVVLAGSWPWGARSTAQLNVSSGRIDGTIDACLWRSQRCTMWRVVLTGSWPWGARSTAQLNVSSGCIDGVIDACYGDYGARCGASCLQDRGRGAHDRQPNSTCRVSASMGSSMHAYGDHNGAQCGASCSQDRGRGAHDRQANSTCRVSASRGSSLRAIATTTALDVARRAHRTDAVGA